jgi:hypothetical protein
MRDKLIMAFAALPMLAAVLSPAAASASPILTHPTGTALEVGAKITGTNVGNIKFRSDPAAGAGEVFEECSTGAMTGTVVKNSGTLITATITTATMLGTGSPLTVGGMNSCTSTSGFTSSISPTTNGGGTDGENVTNGTPWCLRATGSADEFTLRGGGCSEEERKMTLVLDSANPPIGFDSCDYERGSALVGTFTTDSTGDAIAKIAPGATEVEKARATFKAAAGNSFRCPSSFTLEMSYTLEIDTGTAEALFIS